MKHITPAFLTALARFYANTNRWDLEAAGVITAGPSGDVAWKRFNHNFDIFIIKLTDEKRTALVGMVNRFLERGASPGAYEAVPAKQEERA